MKRSRHFEIGPSWCFIAGGVGFAYMRWVIYGRLFGYGLHLSDKKREDALFSERNGYRKAYYFFGLRLEPLRPARNSTE